MGRLFQQTGAGMEMIDQFRDLAGRTEDFTCLLADYPSHTYAVSNQIQPMGGCTHNICGPAFTVRTRGVDLAAVFNALEEAPSGSILVIDAQSTMTAAFTGERVCMRAAERGLAGIIIDGCCRDVEGIARLDYPVYARGSYPAPAQRTGTGQTGVPVVCGGAVVQTGDLVAADASGIVIAPASELGALWEFVAAGAA